MPTTALDLSLVDANRIRNHANEPWTTKWRSRRRWRGRRTPHLHIRHSRLGTGLFVLVAFCAIAATRQSTASRWLTLIALTCWLIQVSWRYLLVALVLYDPKFDPIRGLNEYHLLYLVLPSFVWWYQVLWGLFLFGQTPLDFTEFNSMIRALDCGFTGFYRVLPGFTGFHWVFRWVHLTWLSFSGFLPGFTWFSWALLGFTGFYSVLPRFPFLCIWFHRLLMGFHWLWMGFTGFY